MSMNIKYQSRQEERSENGTSRMIVYTGTQEEMIRQLDSLEISVGVSGERITSAAVSQCSGDIWQCEVKYSNPQSNDSVAAPDESYGRKTAHLSCGMLTLPLEKHKNYRTNWNHYLGAKSGVYNTPFWWESATDEFIGSDDGKQYMWARNAEEIRGRRDDDGARWSILESPQKPGIESYDLATYQITESARFPSPEQAGRMVAGKLNKITSPDQTFGITGGDWKCESASIAWNGKHWIATLTYTSSGNSKGWDNEIYN